ncbi:GbsR/MarR family transcriptional regulator [Propioniferax innocua]|uniref:MarR family protein n=1 Tax=Propioniferax innocua TaxID=1753 RepID=A0A542ZRY7_9ACTN|nr:MarR family transcriptional regulator [Propioniferax innocua]TQL63102.1 MarR family protein [Propioniferax innocua]
MQPEVPDFVDRFADHWAAVGGTRTEGLIAGYLLLDKSEGVSAAELSQRLGVSRGSVSTYTRHLVERGFIRRVRLPGDRTHYFCTDQDVWAGFLRAEQDYLQRQHQLAQEMLGRVEPSGPAWQRLRNMRDYMQWVADNLAPEEWERFKTARDARPEHG